MICLIRPPATESFRFSTLTVTPPLGLAYIAGALEAAGHRPHVLDSVAAAPGQRTRYYKGYLVGLRHQEVVARIPAETRIVGITVIFTHEWPGVVRLVELIKRARPEITVILGGEHITSMPEFCLRTSEADVLVLSEGEETIVELVEALRDDKDLAGITGIAHRKGGRAVVNPRRVRIADVDGIPWPAWHLIDLQTYFDNRFVGGIFTNDLTVPILATRGCPYQCTFCSAPNMWLPRWIPRDPARVVDEIEHYVKTMGARNFPFQDLTAIIRKDWIIAFCREVIDRELDISWQMPSGTRSEAVDPEVADLLKRSGMISMAYAPESGSDETRRKIKKRVKAERLVESIRAAVAAELNVALFIIIGFPHETRADVLENLPFLRRMAREGVTDVSVVFDMVLPGTEIFDELYDAGRVTIDRKYFRHMLHSLALWPSLSYSEHLGVVQLMLLKLRLFAAFFGTRKRGQEGDTIPILNSLRRGFSGLKGGEHSSRLQTVFRNASVAIWDSFRVRFKPGWMPRAAERRMFAEWDGIYREIRTAGGGATARPMGSSRRGRRGDS